MSDGRGGRDIPGQLYQVLLGEVEVSKASMLIGSWVLDDVPKVRLTFAGLEEIGVCFVNWLTEQEVFCGYGRISSPKSPSRRCG